MYNQNLNTASKLLSVYRRCTEIFMAYEPQIMTLSTDTGACEETHQQKKELSINIQRTLILLLFFFLFIF